MAKRLARPRAADDPLGGEYAVVSFRPSWVLVSWTCFLLSLPARAWTRWLPIHLDLPAQRALVPAMAILVLSTVGIVAAWIARRRDPASSAARWALGLNALALALVLLAFLALALIFGVGR
ncbi:MAG: hypothetical protein AAGN46_03150 [Acidobacteriota bacterium]